MWKLRMLTQGMCISLDTNIISIVFDYIEKLVKYLNLLNFSS